VGVDLGVLMDFHLLEAELVYTVRPNKGASAIGDDSYHLEVVDLFSDLLSEQRRQTVASRNVSTTVILATRPGVVELNARAEHDVS
jgi:hypothetical protein